jgi:cysteine-rich repeat protein
MRKKTHSAVLAMASGVAVCAPFASCSSSSPTTVVQDAGPDVTVLKAGECGNGVLNLGEECDLGADGGPGCKKDCHLFCIPDTLNGNAVCDDHNPCNGVETCAGVNNDAGALPHTCIKGAPAPDGTRCGSGSVCKNQTCGGPAVCGNSVVEGTEECDLGSGNGASAACGADCRWTCVPGDATRDCASTNPCAGPGTCDGTTHLCTAGTPAADGTACGTNQVCKGGACISVNCGDGIVEPPEQCDFGAGNGVGTGCETSCQFSCTISPGNNCVTPDPCAGTNTCTAITVGASPGQKCVVGAPPAAGTACLNGGACNAGHLCAGQPGCGNGTLDPGEQCDWGSAMNVTGSGCEPDCTFTCGATALWPNACPGLDPCSAAPQVCEPLAGPTGNSGQKCAPGTLLAPCASCGTGSNLCVNHACKPNSCGDGCMAGAEQCDPPDGKTCDPTCQKVVCGDGQVGGQEQCDDGNTRNLDGCDSSCNFEQLQRATSLQYAQSVDSFCTLNALGTQVITTNGFSVIQATTDTDVASGVTNVIYKFSGSGGQAPDLSGTMGPVVIGALSGTPQFADAGAPDGGGYSGTSDLDWWYTVDPTTIDGSRNPLSTLAGTYANKVLSAGPGLLNMKVNLSGSLAALVMWNAKLKVAIGASGPPTASSGSPPGHLASENIRSGLTSYETTGVGGTGPTGELCGNITALSLSQVLTPPLLVVGNPMGTSCDEGFVASSHLLDVLVRGCKLMGQGIMNATQPDQQLSTVAFPAGTTPPYKLSASSSTTQAVDTCKDSSATPKSVPLATCLAGLAYSSAFTFQTDRVIVK